MKSVIGNNQGLLVGSFSYTTQATSAVLTLAADKQMYVHSASCFNATAASVDMALGARMATAAWKLYTITGAYTDATATVQAGTAVNLIGTTNNYGSLIQAKKQFGLVVMNVSQTEGGSPVYAYQYWNGSAWTALPVSSSPVYTSTGAVVIAFNPPADWVEGNGSLVPALNVGSATSGYCIKVLGTTAPSQAVKITSLQLASLWGYRNVPTKGALRIAFSTHPVMLEGGEGIQPFFSTAGNLNSVEVSYQVSP